MTDTSIQVGDVGTEIVVELLEGDGSGKPVDVSAATLMQIKLLPPSEGAATKVKTASLKNDGGDGKIRVLTADGDIDEAGAWKVQGYVETPAGSWHSTVGHLAVRQNLG